jgi:hypothetical protein
MLPELLIKGLPALWKGGIEYLKRDELREFQLKQLFEICDRKPSAGISVPLNGQS